MFSQGARNAQVFQRLYLQHLLWGILSGTYLRLVLKTFQCNGHLGHPRKEGCEKMTYFIHCLSVRDTTRPFLGECHANSILRDYLLAVVEGEYSKTRADTPKVVEATKPNNPSSDCISADTGRISCL